MAHPRKLIRHAIVARLTNATAAGDRVQATRVDPHKKNELPAISVYTLREPVDAGGDTEPRELTRAVKVEIAIWVAHSDELTADDAMDDAAEQVEAAIDGDRFLGGLAAECVLENTEMQMLDGDPLVGLITLTYSVTYRTSPAAPTLDDFVRAGVDHRLVGGVPDTVPASDLVTVQEAP